MYIYMHTYGILIENLRYGKAKEMTANANTVFLIIYIRKEHAMSLREAPG